jgi:predicted phosphoribosyltransferase
LPQRRARPFAGRLVAVFHDRKEAGRALGDALAAAGITNPVIFGIPRGGVVVAAWAMSSVAQSTSWWP